MASINYDFIKSSQMQVPDLIYEFGMFVNGLGKDSNISNLMTCYVAFQVTHLYSFSQETPISNYMHT